jgi:flagellar hook protein FlgE
MMRSMFAGVSGLQAHQLMMDVVSDNIANINTPGFKSSRVVFEDTLSQLMSGASAPSPFSTDRAKASSNITRLAW